MAKNKDIGKPTPGQGYDGNKPEPKSLEEIKTGPMQFEVEDNGDWVLGTTWGAGGGGNNNKVTLVSGGGGGSTANWTMTAYEPITATTYTFTTATTATDAMWEGMVPTPPVKKDERASRKDRFANFFKFARNLERAVVTFNPRPDTYGKAGPKGKGFDDTNVITDSDPDLVDATAVCSKVHKKHHMPGLHKIVLDIDHNATLVPSSTSGHHHLFIEKYLTWEAYREVLEVLGRHGIIQKGYADASIKRGATWVRTPWTLKGQSAIPFETTSGLQSVAEATACLQSVTEATASANEVLKNQLAYYAMTMTAEKYAEFCAEHGFTIDGNLKALESTNEEGNKADADTAK